MKLISLPDNKFVHEFLTLGKEYEPLYFSSNGVIIVMDNGEKAAILAERFE
jgi:hypothetical protein